MSATISTSTNTQQQRTYEFIAELDAWAAQLDDRLNEAYRNIIFVLLMNVVVGGLYSCGTPHDLGFAQNSWVVGIGAPGAFRQPENMSAEDRKARRQVAVVSIEEGNTIILDVKYEDEVHLSSNCVYMGSLEDGHSGQAPTGFVWLAIHAGQQIVNQVCREMLS